MDIDVHLLCYCIDFAYLLCFGMSGCINALSHVHIYIIYYLIFVSTLIYQSLVASQFKPEAINVGPNCHNFWRQIVRRERERGVDPDADTEGN